VLAKNDLGRRVVVRRTLGRSESPFFTDVLGVVTQITNDQLTVRTDQGDVVIPLSEVHRAKVIPPRRGATAREIANLERAAADAWPPTVVEELGAWRLRAAEGYTGRANSALPLGDPGLPTPQALAAVIDFYREHDLPPQVDVPLPLATSVERELRKAGWQPQCTVLVQVMELPALIEATPDGAEFTLSSTPSESALTMIAGRRGPLPPAAQHVLTGVDPVVFAELGGEDLRCMARGTVTGGWLGLFVVETAASARRQGLARRAVGALARWAATNAATGAFLQVESNNQPAISLYESIGFRTHHRYTRYRL
jgi:GNAT superfamily N-acetyltransferase